MKLQTVILCAIVMLLLVISTERARSDELQRGYVVEQVILSGGRFHLTSTVWQIRGMADGGEYRLFSFSTPNLRGSGCCCTYLPCVLRQSP